MIGLSLSQIREEKIEDRRVLIDEFGRTWTGVTNKASSTYSHDEAGGIIVPDGGSGDEAWVLTSFSEAGYQDVPIPMDTAFVDGTTNGIDATVFGFRFNNTIDDQPLKAIVSVPDDMDTAADVTVQVRIKLTGSTDTTTKAVLVARFDGGSDIAPASTVNLTTSYQTIEFALPNASISAGVRGLWLELDCDASLDTDDAICVGLGIKYVRKGSVQ